MCGSRFHSAPRFLPDRCFLIGEEEGGDAVTGGESGLGAAEFGEFAGDTDNQSEVALEAEGWTLVRGMEPVNVGGFSGAGVGTAEGLVQQRVIGFIFPVDHFFRSDTGGEVLFCATDIAGETYQGFQDLCEIAAAHGATGGGFQRNRHATLASPFQELWCDRREDVADTHVVSPELPGLMTDPKAIYLNIVVALEDGVQAECLWNTRTLVFL